MQLLKDKKVLIILLIAAAAIMFALMNGNSKAGTYSLISDNLYAYGENLNGPTMWGQTLILDGGIKKGVKVSYNRSREYGLSYSGTVTTVSSSSGKKSGHVSWRQTPDYFDGAYYSSTEIYFEGSVLVLHIEWRYRLDSGQFATIDEYCRFKK